MKATRNVDTLQRLYKHERIDKPAYDAGRQFEDDFLAAKLGGICATPYIERCDNSITSASSVERAIAMSHRTDQALNKLGGIASPCGKAAWNVLGLGAPIPQWAASAGYDQKEARGIVISCLAVLAKHYGFSE